MRETREISKQCNTLEEVMNSEDFLRGVEKVAKIAGYDEDTSQGVTPQDIRGYFERGIENLSDEELGEVLKFVGNSDVGEKTKKLIERLAKGIEVGDSEISEDDLNEFMIDFFENGSNRLREKVKSDVIGALESTNNQSSRENTDQSKIVEESERNELSLEEALEKLAGVLYGDQKENILKIKRGELSINKPIDDHEATVLHVAPAKDECKEIVEPIISSVSNPEELIFMQTKDGDTALHGAAMIVYEHIKEMVELLLNSVSNPEELIYMKNNNGDTAMDMARRRNNWGTYALLKSYLPPENQPGEESTDQSEAKEQEKNGNM